MDRKRFRRTGYASASEDTASICVATAKALGVAGPTYQTPATIRGPATTHQVPVSGVQDPPDSPTNTLRSIPSNWAMSLRVRLPAWYTVPQH